MSQPPWCRTRCVTGGSPLRVGGPGVQRRVKPCGSCASAPFGAAGPRRRGPAWPAPPGWTAARRTSPSGCAPATSPSSTTSTSTASAPTPSSAARSPRSSTPRPSISGRYPNLGPEILIAAGIPLLDDVGREVFTRAQGGHRTSASTATSCSTEDGTVLAEGIAQDDATRRRGDGRGEGRAVDPARGVRRQHDGVHEAGARAPARRRRRARRRHRRSTAGTSLVVVRGYDYKEDLAGPPPLHPRLPAGPHRRRRRRRRAASRPATSRT